MKLINKGTNVLKYMENGSKFTMINMGDFIHHNERDILDASEVVWKLIFLDKNNINIEGLINSEGDYVRFIVKLNNFTRTISLRDNKVFQDLICSYKDGRLTYKSIYYAKKDSPYPKDQLNLDDYLEKKVYVEGMNNPDEFIITDNNLIADFLLKSEELEEMLQENITRTK